MTNLGTVVELVSKSGGVGKYDGLSQGQMVEAVARHGKIKGYGRLIKYLIEHKHWSPLEHVHFTFRILTGRDVSAQMMRHRSFHWQEYSQRYSEVQQFMPIEIRKQAEKNHQSSEDVFDPMIKKMVLAGGHGIPDYLPMDVPASKVVKDILKRVQKAYSDLLDAGVARECARRILPMCAQTTVHMTGNLRDFLGYLNVRCEAGTQKEHREVALMIGELLELEMPEIFEMIDWRNGDFM